DLEAYRVATQRLGRLLTQLEAEPDRGHDMGRLLEAVDAKMAWMASVVDLRTRGGADVAARASRAPEGARLMREAIDQIRRVEMAQSDDIDAMVRAETRRVGRLQVTLSLMFVALAAAALGVAVAVARLLTAR